MVGTIIGQLADDLTGCTALSADMERISLWLSVWKKPFQAFHEVWWNFIINHGRIVDDKKKITADIAEKDYF